MDVHEEILQEALQDDNQKPPWWKRPAVNLFSLLLVILMLSFVFVTYPIDSIIRGRWASSPLTNNRIVTEKYTITFDENVILSLQKAYFSEQKVEWTACLQGTKKGNQYYITTWYPPKQFLQTYNHVRFEPCVDSLIMLHSHPYKNCQASPTDLQTLKETRILEPDTVMLIMCEPDRMAIY